MIRRTSAIVILCISATFALGQVPHDLTAEPQTILLWQNGAPGALGQGEDDQPTITVYRPWGHNLSGTAVIVAPGGSYGFLAANHEGRQVANWFNALGITAFVLKYRLGPRYHHPIELGDAQRAIRLVRSRASGIRDLARPHWNDGLLGGRTSGFDRRNSLRQRQSCGRRPHRSRRQPS